MDTFYVVTPPGFEDETLQEIREVWPRLLGADAKPHSQAFPEWRKSLGGLEAEVDPVLAVQLNFFLKTASRVLWRIARFKAKDFGRFQEKLATVKWEPRLGPQRFSLEAASQSSRLYNETKIKELAGQAWKSRLDVNSDIAVLIRFENDEGTVSLDTTGEHLHRRGLIQDRGPAPVRETIAAFCLRKMGAEFQGTLIDPCCGSGTFLIEARELHEGNFVRPYSFQKFHGLPKLFKLPLLEKNYVKTAAQFPRRRGYDLDGKVLEAARRNESRFERSRGDVSYEQADLFKLTPQKIDGPVWVVANPPYGERIEGESAQKWLDQIVKVWSPDKVGLLLPKPMSQSLRPPMGYQGERFPLKNGGIDCYWTVYSTSS